jgi:hypothetical protein
LLQAKNNKKKSTLEENEAKDEAKERKAETNERYQ